MESSRVLSSQKSETLRVLNMKQMTTFQRRRTTTTARQIKNLLRRNARRLGQTTEMRSTARTSLLSVLLRFWGQRSARLASQDPKPTSRFRNSPPLRARRNQKQKTSGELRRQRKHEKEEGLGRPMLKFLWTSRT